MDRSTADMIIALEESLHQPSVRGAQHLVANLLAEEFIEFGRSGQVFDKHVTVSSLAAEKPSNDRPALQAFDFAVTELAGDVLLVTYRTLRDAGSVKGARETLRSSIWKRDKDHWQMVFHQGTPVACV